MRKALIFSVAFIFVFLVSICVVEDLVVTNGVRAVNEQCMSIEELIHDKDDLRDMSVVMAVENLEYEWKKNESMMCYLVNHKNIQEIGVEISKLKGFLDNNEFNDFESSLDAIKYYSHAYLHFMGASLHNVL